MEADRLVLRWDTTGGFVSLDPGGASWLLVDPSGERAPELSGATLAELAPALRAEATRFAGQGASDVVSTDRFWELVADHPLLRLERVEGRIFAMAGGTLDHNTVNGGIGAALHAALPRRCRIMPSDGYVLIGDEEDGAYVHPDHTVVCGQPIEGRSPKGRRLLLNPSLLAEVLSPGTRAHDLGTKLDRYSRIQTLQHYLVVDPESREVRLWTREGGALLPQAVPPDGILDILGHRVDSSLFFWRLDPE